MIRTLRFVSLLATCTAAVGAQSGKAPPAPPDAPVAVPAPTPLVAPPAPLARLRLGDLNLDLGQQLRMELLDSDVRRLAQQA